MNQSDIDILANAIPKEGIEFTVEKSLSEDANERLLKSKGILPERIVTYTFKVFPNADSILGLFQHAANGGKVRHVKEYDSKFIDTRDCLYSTRKGSKGKDPIDEKTKIINAMENYIIKTFPNIDTTTMDPIAIESFFNDNIRSIR